MWNQAPPKSSATTTPSSSLTSSAASTSTVSAATTALDTTHPEIELYTSTKERKDYENMADLYTIIVATEHLERAYAQNAISQSEYTSECNKLLSQFKIAEKAALLSSSSSSSGATKARITTTETFMRVYQMDCPRASHRLLTVGVPEKTKENIADSAGKLAAIVAETVKDFINAMDAIHLGQRSVDEIQPLLSDLQSSMNRLPLETPPNFGPVVIVQCWLEKLNGMRAVDVIDEDDGQQLKFELNKAYTEFTRYLNDVGIGD